MIKSLLSILLAISLIVNFQLDSNAQPTNDSPCAAISIIVDDLPVVMDNTGATTDAGEVVPPLWTFGGSCIFAWCADDAGAQNSVWFSFVAPTNGAVVINTCLDTTAIDTQVALWQASDCADYVGFTYVGANDDVPGGCDNGSTYASTLSLDGLNAGETYYIQVDGFDAEEGTFGIEVLGGVPESRVNFIHNSADIAVEMVDVRVNGMLIADDFEFQSCTGYIDIPADVDSYITINPADSEDDSAPLANVNVTLNSSLNYLLTISGISSLTGYTPAPPLAINLYEGALINAQTSGTIPIIFFHGATDAPTVDLVNGETTTLINNNLQYGAYSAEGYLTSQGESFSLMLTDEDGNDIGYNFCLPIAGGAQFNAAFTLVISGFATPANNSNGLPLEVSIVNHFDGTFIPLEAGLCAFPDNDDICNAMELIVNDPPVTVDNSLASVQENESSTNNLPSGDPESDCLFSWCDGILDNTLWFNFVAPASGAVTVSTCFPVTIDTQVALCEVGNCNDFATVTYLGSNDDMDGGCDDGDEFASHFVVNGLTSGNTYFLQADGWEGSVGEFQIQVTELTIDIDEHHSNNIVIFPNPANDLLSIRGMKEKQLVEIRDVQGKTVLSSIISNGTINVSSIASGVYTLFIHSGDSVITEKLVIE